MSETFSASLKLSLDDQLSNPLLKLGEAFDKLQNNFNKADSEMGTLGKRMTAFATVPIMGWATFAAHKAGDVKVAFREMNEALEKAPREQLQGLEADLRKMSTQMPK